MKNKISILTIYLTFTLIGHAYGQKGIFLSTYFIDDSVTKTIIINKKTDTIVIDNKQLDVDFYGKHFFLLPYSFPKTFINPELKDTIVVAWNSERHEKNYLWNWTSTCFYDSLSRLVNYEFSGCGICNSLPFQLTIYFDSLKRPVIIEKRINK